MGMSSKRSRSSNLKLTKLWSLHSFPMQRKPTARDLPPRVPSPKYNPNEVQVAQLPIVEFFKQKKCLHQELVVGTGNWKTRGKAPVWTWVWNE